MWAAMKGREAFTVEWDDGKAEKRSTSALAASYRELAARPGAVARNEGDVDGAFAKAAKVLEATFEFPYLAHAALEPMNAERFCGEITTEIHHRAARRRWKELRGWRLARRTRGAVE
jgi:CO/xanthine dehydrogenase Mo-binding subunit